MTVRGRAATSPAVLAERAELRKRVGDNMRRIRQAKGIKLVVIEAISGVHRSAIQAYERGRSAMTIPVAIKVADALGVSLDELAGRGPSVDEILRRAGLRPLGEYESG